MLSPGPPALRGNCRPSPALERPGCSCQPDRAEVADPEHYRSQRRGSSVREWRGPCEPMIRVAANGRDRKSTRLNSSHQIISYAVFCLKKKKNKQSKTTCVL